jgi:hypothetical protein
MLLTEDSQFRELDRRCDLALAARSAQDLLRVMGTYLNANIPGLPEPLRSKFGKVLDVLAYKTFVQPARS